MDFYIRKNSTEPIVKMKVIQDGRNDYQNLHDQLANSSIKFSMIIHQENIIYIIGGKMETRLNQVDTKPNLVFI